MQYKEQIIQRLPKIDYPEISSLADPSKTNNQTIEMAQYRLESIFKFLAFLTTSSVIFVDDLTASPS